VERWGAIQAAQQAGSSRNPTWLPTATPRSQAEPSFRSLFPRERGAVVCHVFAVRREEAGAPSAGSAATPPLPLAAVGFHRASTNSPEEMNEIIVSNVQQLLGNGREVGWV